MLFMTTRIRTIVALASLAAPSAALAAPAESATDEGLERPAIQDLGFDVDNPDLNPDVIAHAQDLVFQAHSKFDLGDYEGAIELWEQAYRLLPLSSRGQLMAPLANAHVRAYEVSKDPAHLAQAKVLFEGQLELLDADDDIRVNVEEALDDVEAELARLEQERLEREREREREEAAARAEAVRAAKLESAPTTTEPVDTWTAQDRGRFRVYLGVGGSLVGLGIGGLGAMAAGIALGSDVDRRGAALDASASSEDYQDLRAEGVAYNQMAWITGAIGGALVVTGAALVIVAVVQKRRGDRPSAARLQPHITGLRLHF